MAIVLEGFDNSGKTTLGKRLAKALGTPVMHPGPRPMTPEQVDECLSKQRRLMRYPLIMDRVTCISHNAYSKDEALDMYLVSEAHFLFGPPTDNTLIYCRPPLEVIKDFSKHEVKFYDEELHLDWIKRNADRVVARYDEIMASLPHIKWDYTASDFEELAKRIEG